MGVNCILAGKLAVYSPLIYSTTKKEYQQYLRRSPAVFVVVFLADPVNPAIL